jgi:hypothetical protein
MRLTWMICACSLSLEASALAQQPEQPPPGKVSYENLPPSIKLGLKAEALQRATPVDPVVVVVPDGGSYLEAVSGWTPGIRFPVLIDDGSMAAAEDIGRFVRGFKPAKVVRWSGKTALPAEGGARRSAVEAGLRKTWSAAVNGEPEAAKMESQGELISRWQKMGAPRTGIVIAADNDPAWTAALALAAGRAQPLAWVARPPSPTVASMSVADFRKFESDIEKACEGTGLKWNAMGDDIDAVTLCMASSVRVQAEPSLVLATTDCLARPLADEQQRIGKEERWAWCGQIFGSESHSAYMAMCSLFLSTKKAWLFDGYPDTKPWSDFDASAAAGFLKKVGIESSVERSPKNGERDWRVRAAVPVDAGFIAVNTKGMANFFELEPGQCLPADVPELNVPSMLYLVHSWSAFSPSEHWTFGGRWVERGVYAYLGSVDEPYLQAFIPTPGVAMRMAGKLPFGAAVRFDNGPAWKLTVIGDPLTLLGNAPVRGEEKVPLDGATDVQEELKAALAEKAYEKILRALVLQGRDADAAAVAKGLFKEDAKAVTPKIAALAILPLFRSGDHESMMKAFAVLPAGADPMLKDAVWLAAYPMLRTTRDATVLGALRSAIRDDSWVRDALDLAEPYERAFGRDEAAGILEDAKTHTKDANEKGRLDREIQRITSLRSRGR